MEETTERITGLLSNFIESFRQVIPIPAFAQSPNVLLDSVVQSDIGVLIGFTGDIHGRIVMQGDSSTFGKLGLSMYGMQLEDEVLHSFIGELANMIAGNASTLISKAGKTIDITPPTVMVGALHLYGFDRGLSVSLRIDQVGEINIILLLQKQGV
ncbi:MAG: chemotaxis protein CheX [Candidatus Cohnella colombiensis]|uniref:Chemotaxis protein CheX n=1 Tax=Candidatus Cohnella colombiensis TaxID=3121368 RepID=A0AA95EZ29_9BACL|nr:MAG: chemotaxis protein CheX [Cohnella sp.]